ncbi:MAG TPA: class II D-tagatose-bisphosphate aldolase, non-catalytic subunit [Erysipelotrichaceae bacterium]|nr:class II D-tagatose-bisphosphate aldolase, non-catalytic subunit [Erysipelotrichia bacterium]HPX32147.1 class II D-tagatose-bisphosphate aldolase, non-catalytic subunit [Erysipelotrichaceae bacterium]HQA84520.1 class II D-tagatose-bisphosphate aldolase, non-catalytic subunit [Erysipelotrichaceae bacterium]
MKNHPLKKIVTYQKKNDPVGIYSVCSANAFVIKAALRRGLQTKTPVLIEATSNQVNQYGGYTGMKPKDFKKFVFDIAKEENFPPENIILGGDHLGPLTWASLNEKEAMEEASKLIELYILAGYTKIHIDTSMKLNDDDNNTTLSTEIIAKRGATLAEIAQKAYKELLKSNPNAIAPVYIVGSEVPIPGGAIAKTDNTEVQVTKVEDFKATYDTFKKAFNEKNLNDAWENVIGIVVQPGVEEKDTGCTEYDRNKAKDLMNSIKKYNNIFFEGHSTDYQTKKALKELVEDGVGVLKVGPGLTFAAREALFALAFAEKEQFKNTNVKQSNFIEILDKEMLKNPVNWQKHYTGTPQEIALKRKYSFSDRSRYYMPTKNVTNSIKILFNNFKEGVPLNLLSQFMPIQYTKIRDGLIKNKPEDIVVDRIVNTIDEYLQATNQQKLWI